MWTGSTWPPRCETKCASAPRRAGGCREAGLGEEGSRGQWTWLTTSHLFCSPSGLLLLPPGLPGGWGAETYYPHTPALCVSYRVNSPL